MGKAASLIEPKVWVYALQGDVSVVVPCVLGSAAKDDLPSWGVTLLRQASGRFAV